MKRTFTALNHTFFPTGWPLFLVTLLLLAHAGLQAQTLPGINAVNGLVPGCATEEQALPLTINGSNFSSQARVRIRGTAFSGDIFITPTTSPSATRIDITLPFNSVVLSGPGTLTIDIQQPDAEGDLVFSNAVQLPVYPKTGAISGAAVVCGNTQNNYTVARLTGAASYTWSVVSGNATIVSGGTTNTPRIGFANTAGTVRIAVTTMNACGTTGTTSTLDIQVKAASTVSLAAFGAVCVNAAPFALTGGSPAGGTYTVDGVVASSFNPAAAGVGDHAITYYFTQNGCSASATQTISVLAAPAVTFASAFPPICVNAGPLTLSGGTPAGGSYSGPGVTGTTFDPAVAGEGTHTITYTLSQGGCSGSAVQTIEVLPAPAVSLADFGTICVNTPAFALAGGSPAGGTFTVDGVAATTFNPAAAGVGTYTVVYTVSQGGCNASATQTLSVLAAPAVSFTAAFNAVCVNAEPFTLSGGSPAGGSYSGPGVTDNTFDPATAGVGTHTITYTVTQNGCSNSVNQDITVLDTPAAGIIAPAGGTQACPGASVALSATPAATGATYQWLLNGNPIPGAVNSTFNAGASGSYQVQVTAGSCSAVSEAVGVTILAPANIIVEESPVSFCAGGNVVLNALTGTNYAYQWYRNGNLIPGATASTRTVTEVGTYTVVLTAPGCDPITSEAIAVSETPQITNNNITTAETVICMGATIQITGSVPTGGSGPYVYQWQRRLGTGNMVDIPGATGQNLTYVSGEFAGSISFRRLVTSGLCSSTSNQVDITVNQVIAGNTIAAPAVATICAGQAPGTITGSAATGAPNIVYAWQSRVNGTAFAVIPGADAADFTPAALTRTTIFRRVVSSGACTDISNTVTITVQPAIAGNSIAASVDLICSNTDAGTLTGGALTGGGNGYSYVWESSPDGEAFTAIAGATAATFAPGVLTQTTTFRRLVSSGACSDTSNAVTITVNEVITGNNLTVAAATVCSGAAAATITGDSLSGGDGTFSYVWESSPDGVAFTPIAGATAATFAPGVLTQTTTFRRLVSSGACTSTSNTITITVEPLATYTVFLTVAGSLPVCGETQYVARVIRNVSVVTYPADARNQAVSWEGGEDVTSLFAFDWWQNDAQSLASGTGGTITLPALQPGAYYTVRAQPVSGELACAIYNNRPDLVAADAGTALLFSNRIFSGHEEGYGVSITSDLQSPICPGTAVTFTAYPNDPAYINPTYQWVVNQQDIPGANQASFTTSDLQEGDVVTVRFNSDENNCSPVTAANPVTMQLTPLVANEIANIEKPAKPGTGLPATFRVIPADITIGWRYQWILTYADGREETSPETSATLTIASFPADLQEINVTQIAPEGNCVNQESTSLTAFSAPLPVELLYLKASKKGRNVVVEWATSTEQYNAGFEVQVSADAVNYQLLSFVPSKNANSTAKQVYTYTDQEKGLSGTRYYRLKQVDITGEFKFYGPVAAKTEELASHIVAYPNPFTSEIHLEMEAAEAGNMSLVMLNALGSKVAERTLPVKKGFNQQMLSFNFHLPAGVYTILLHMNGRSSRIKLLKR